jgi:glycogen operon protein
MGDEMRRTQRGNNNAYCQDNEISWLDWSLLEKHGDVKRFFSLLAARRLLRDADPELERESLNQRLRASRIAWHGVQCGKPDWGDDSRSIAFSALLPNEKLEVYVALNGYWESLDFELPPCSGAVKGWRRWIDTGRATPEDIVPWRDAKPVAESVYRLAPRAVLALFASA